MFSKNISMSIIQLYRFRNLSFEEAGGVMWPQPKILRQRYQRADNASIITHEKLYIGFEFTPNELLRIPPLADSKMPMAVVKSCFICGLDCYPMCTYCKFTLDRE